MKRSDFAEHDVFVTVRIPATWEHPQEMLAAISKDCRCLPDRFISDDRTEFDMNLRDPDDQFVGVFAGQCRREPTEAEKLAIENYTVQVCLTCRGGTKRSAAALCRAVNHFLDAGAWGVFVDNSGVAFAKTAFQEVTSELQSDFRDGGLDPTDPDFEALSFAFVSVVEGRAKAYTHGMQILGYPDIELNRPESGQLGARLIDVLRYVSSGIAPIADGDMLGDLDGPEYKIHTIPDPHPESHPMYNPFGRLRLISIDDIAKTN